MSLYWNSENLTFSSGGDVTRGYQATLQRYKERYPTTEKMGKLAFTQLEFLPLGDSVMQVLGVWQLDRQEDSMGGRFTLVFQRIAGRWQIVHDHTSKFSTP